MTLKVVWDKKAFSKLQDLEPLLAKRIAEKVGELIVDSPSKHVKKLRGSDCFRLRVGDYRVIFSIDDGLIKVLNVGHRKNIYKR